MPDPKTRPAGLPRKIKAWWWKALKAPGKVARPKSALFWAWRKWRLTKAQPVVNPTRPIVMDDSVNLAEIPKTAQAVGGYVGGRWPTYANGSVQRGWPHAYWCSFAVAVNYDADMLDIERGDATPDQAPTWLKRQLARRSRNAGSYNTRLPGVYIDRADADALVELLAKHALLHGRDYLLATAHYTGEQHFCGPKTCGLHATADATQWTDKALHRNLDQWIVSPMFFKPKPITT